MCVCERERGACVRARACVLCLILYICTQRADTRRSTGAGALRPEHARDQNTQVPDSSALARTRAPSFVQPGNTRASGFGDG